MTAPVLLTEEQIESIRTYCCLIGPDGTDAEATDRLCDQALLSLTQGAEAVRWKIERDEARAALADACDELAQRGAPGFAAVMRKAGGL